MTDTLTVDEQVMLSRTWPAHIDRSEVHRAVSGPWARTRFVWQEAERTVGRSLGIELDERAMLRAIYGFYTLSRES